MPEKILGSSGSAGGVSAGGQPYAARFTPGPWRAAHNGTCWQIDADVDAVATTQFCYAADPETNAHLVAAAPELYAALRTLAEHYADLVHSGDCGFWNPENEAPMKAARAALAKASPAATPIRQNAGSVTDETDTTARTPLVTDEPEG